MRPHLLVLFLFLSASSAEQRRVRSVEEECRAEHPTLLYYFSWVDYTVFATMLIVSCLIGTFYGFFAKKQETSQDFLLGGSSMGTFPTAMSLTASFITAIELLGNPAEMYEQVRQWIIKFHNGDDRKKKVRIAKRENRSSINRIFFKSHLRKSRRFLRCRELNSGWLASLSYSWYRSPLACTCRCSWS